MQVAAVLARAQSAIGMGIAYGLGKGGFSPGSPTPASTPYGANSCDCSGFISWCLGMSRKTNQNFYVSFNGRWIETTAVWSDIQAHAGIFEPSEEVPGAVVVYPDSNGRQGHIGIVSRPGHVIHCSNGNYEHFRDAIQETDDQVFKANSKTTYGWYYGLLS